MGEPITKEEREAMLLGALEAAEAETERMREAAQVAEADVQRLTAELERLRPLVEAAKRILQATLMF